MGVSPDYGDEPLGISVEELLEILYQAGLQAGRERFGGLSIMALPPSAHTYHWIMMYAQLYALAGMVESVAGWSVGAVTLEERAAVHVPG